MSAQRKIPKRVKRLFWDVKKEEVNLELHYPYIISRIMDFGNEEDVQWMLKTFSQEQIKEVVKKRKGLSKKSAIFWSVYLGIPRGEIECLKTP